MEIVKSKLITRVTLFLALTFLFGACAFAQNIESIDSSYFDNDSTLVLKMKYDYRFADTYIYDRLDAKIVFDGNNEIQFLNIQFDIKSKEIKIRVPKSNLYVLNRRVKTEVFTKFHVIGDTEGYLYGYYLEVL